MATAVATKTVIILNRYFIKRNGSVVCHIRNGENKEYYVTLNANGTTGCTCKAGEHGRKCYHIKACQAKEAERREQAVVAQAVAVVAQVVQAEDAEYEAWKRENSLVADTSVWAYEMGYYPE